jgi:hypothetical protein
MAARRGTGHSNFKRLFRLFTALGKVEHTSVPKGEPAGYVPLLLSHVAGLGDNAVRHIAGANPRWPIRIGRARTGGLIAETHCAGRLRREVGDRLRQTLRHRSRCRAIRRRRDLMRIDEIR